MRDDGTRRSVERHEARDGAGHAHEVRAPTIRGAVAGKIGEHDVEAAPAEERDELGELTAAALPAVDQEHPRCGFERQRGRAPTATPGRS
jgi:hypothetical protein